MPRFIMTGSMISAATFPSCSSSVRARASGWLNGTTRVIAATVAGIPVEGGAARRGGGAEGEREGGVVGAVAAPRGGPLPAGEVEGGGGVILEGGRHAERE